MLNQPTSLQESRRLKDASFMKRFRKMLDEGIVQPSESPWSSPRCARKKKDGSWRFCVDYRKLNSVSRRQKLILWPQLTIRSTV
ncbi:hypothetical protein TNCV_4323401 [Trichonephila clavipes]|nr:hypothetical protein TNCV_4323401 [Trichonephila clavipes]